MIPIALYRPELIVRGQFVVVEAEIHTQLLLATPNSYSMNVLRGGETKMPDLLVRLALAVLTYSKILSSAHELV